MRREASGSFGGGRDQGALDAGCFFGRGGRVAGSRFGGLRGVFVGAGGVRMFARFDRGVPVTRYAMRADIAVFAGIVFADRIVFVVVHGIELRAPDLAELDLLGVLDPLDSHEAAGAEEGEHEADDQGLCGGRFARSRPPGPWLKLLAMSTTVLIAPMLLSRNVCPISKISGWFAR